MQTQEKQDLQNHVDHIAATLSNGMTYEDAGIDHEEYGCEPDDMISGFDWLQDILDIEYTVDSQGEYLSARILVAFGGPNIWVDTRWHKVEGFWWGDSASATFTDEMGIDEACRELFAC